MMRIGGVLIVGVPAEVLMALGTAIKREIPDYDILTLGCACRWQPVQVKRWRQKLFEP